MSTDPQGNFVYFMELWQRNTSFPMLVGGLVVIVHSSTEIQPFGVQTTPS